MMSDENKLLRFQRLYAKVSLEQAYNADDVLIYKLGQGKKMLCCPQRPTLFKNKNKKK